MHFGPHRIHGSQGEQRKLIENENNPSLLGISDVHVRHAFIQKVYGILGFQLVVTTVLAGLVFKYGEALVRSNPGLAMSMIFFSMAVSIGMLCTFICCRDTMRKSPQNYIILTLFTIAESVLVGFITLRYTQESVLVTLAITALIVVSLSIFACQTKMDFTGYGPYLFCGMMVLFAFSFVFMVAGFAGLGNSAAFQTMHLVYSACAALLFSAFIVYDTQLIVGGNHHEHQFSVDDYAMAAITLYIDIVQLFIHLLQLFGKRR